MYNVERRLSFHRPLPSHFFYPFSLPSSTLSGDLGTPLRLEQAGNG